MPHNNIASNDNEFDDSSIHSFHSACSNNNECGNGKYFAESSKNLLHDCYLHRSAIIQTNDPVLDSDENVIDANDYP